MNKICFFSQVLGGYFSDRIGGQRVIFLAAVGWSLITFYMPELLVLMPRTWPYTIHFIVAIRILNGACQGVHFPSMISLTSQVSVNFPSDRLSPNSSMLKCFFSIPEFERKRTYQLFQFAALWFSIRHPIDWHHGIIPARLLRLANRISDNWISWYCMGIDDALLLNGFRS